jgi:hypothetical protein
MVLCSVFRVEAVFIFMCSVFGLQGLVCSEAFCVGLPLAASVGAVFLSLLRAAKLREHYLGVEVEGFGCKGWG